MKSKAMLFATAALALQACATGPVVSYKHIADPQQLFSAADWTPDLDAAVKVAGLADRIPEIQAHMDEKGGWPDKMKDADARWLQMRTIMKYNVEEIARLNFHDQPAILLRVAANANGHMPEGWKPKADFYIVVGTAAFVTPTDLPN
ncbi:MAG: hypothetical protein ABMA14_04070 [Hyphomonadaceae bacterium]